MNGSEERKRHDAREGDDARLGRRVGEREHEERVRDRRRGGAGRRQQLARLQEDEISVAAERDWPNRIGGGHPATVAPWSAIDRAPEVHG